MCVSACACVCLWSGGHQGAFACGLARVGEDCNWRLPFCFFSPSWHHHATMVWSGSLGFIMWPCFPSVFSVVWQVAARGRWSPLRRAWVGAVARLMTSPFGLVRHRPLRWALAMRPQSGACDAATTGPRVRRRRCRVGCCGSGGCEEGGDDSGDSSSGDGCCGVGHCCCQSQNDSWV